MSQSRKKTHNGPKTQSQSTSNYTKHTKAEALALREEQARLNSRLNSVRSSAMKSIRGSKEHLSVASTLLGSIINPIDDNSDVSRIPCPAFDGQMTATYRGDASVAVLPHVPEFENYDPKGDSACTMVIGFNRTRRRYAYSTPDVANYSAMVGSGILDIKGGSSFALTLNPELAPFSVSDAGDRTDFSGFFESPDDQGETMLGAMPSADGAWYPAFLADVKGNCELAVIAQAPEATSLWAVRYVRIKADNSLATCPWGVVNPLSGTALAKTGITLATGGIGTDKGFKIQFISSAPTTSQVSVSLLFVKAVVTDPLVAGSIFQSKPCASNLVVRGNSLAPDIANFNREAIVSAAELVTNVTPTINRGGTAYCIRLPTRTQIADFYRKSTNIDSAIIQCSGIPKYKGDLSIGLNCFHIGNGNERDVIAGSIDKVDLRLYYCVSPGVGNVQTLTLRCRDVFSYTSNAPVITLHPSPRCELARDVYESLSAVNPCGSNEGHMDKVKGIVNQLGKYLTSDTAYDLYNKGYDALAKGLKLWLTSKFDQAKSVASPELGGRIKSGRRDREIWEQEF